MVLRIIEYHVSLYYILFSIIPSLDDSKYTLLSGWLPKISLISSGIVIYPLSVKLLVFIIFESLYNYIYCVFIPISYIYYLKSDNIGYQQKISI